MGEFIASGTHWRIFNFLVFLVVLFFALRRPVKEFWASRAYGIAFEIDEAARLKRETRERHDTLQRRLSRIEGEMADLIRSLEGDGELERKRLVADAEQFAERLKKDSERIATQEVRKAEELLKNEAVRLSLELAEKLIRENFKDSDQVRMVERHLTSLEEGVE